MRHTLAILLLLFSFTGAQAHCCFGGYHRSYCGPACYSPPVYAMPYWSSPIYYQPVWVNPVVMPVTQVPVYGITNPPRTKPAEGANPKIANPRIPVDNTEPKKILPAPKAVPPAKIDQPKTKEKEKSVSIDQFLIPAEKIRAEAPAEVKVGIFNHSDREMELEINGESVKLPADQYVTLRMPRTFTWAVKGQTAKEVKVPADADGLEIVFRK
ncbi:hypothetical protein [Zavarzinella formosa]|uniref:hypothetical protein n=1 Tax=Zavarzinella formosa TaxID=360055 RepID=UPI00036699EB|nr:hypothetical protein [Zavarzinella formosa]